MRHFVAGRFDITAEEPNDDWGHRDGRVSWASYGSMSWKEATEFKNLLAEAIDFVRQADIRHECVEQPSRD